MTHEEQEKNHEEMFSLMGKYFYDDIKRFNGDYYYYKQVTKDTAIIIQEYAKPIIGQRGSITGRHKHLGNLVSWMWPDIDRLEVMLTDINRELEKLLTNYKEG